jgi:hypothetical protein
MIRLTYEKFFPIHPRSATHELRIVVSVLRPYLNSPLKNGIFGNAGLSGGGESGTAGWGRVGESGLE